MSDSLRNKILYFHNRYRREIEDAIYKEKNKFSRDRYRQDSKIF